MGIFSFILTLVVVALIIAAIAKIFEKVIESIMLGFFNRVAGAVFGFVKGMVMISLFIMLLGFLNIEDKLINPGKQQGSRFYGDVKSFAPFIFRVFDLDEAIENLKKWGEEEEKSSTSII